MILNMVGGMAICANLAVMAPNYMISTIFLREQLGASRTLVGLNFALWMLAVILCLPGAWLFNNLVVRKRIWVSLMVIGRSFFFLVALAAVLSYESRWQHHLALLVVAANVACVALTSYTAAGWWSWMADLIPESIRGHFFGKRYQLILLATAAGTVSASIILERINAPRHILFFGIFFVASLLGVLDPVLFCWIPEPARPPRPRTSLSEAISLYARPLLDKGYLRLIVAAGIQTLVYNVPLPFFVLYQRGETIGGQYIGCGCSMQFMAFMTVLQQVATAAVAAQWGHLADRIGHRPVFILGNLQIFVTILYFFMGPQNVLWLLPVFMILNSLVAAGWQVAMQNMMIGIAPQAEREYYVSTFWAVVCGTAAIGPWLGGVIADAVPTTSIMLPHGQPLSYLHLLLIIGCVLTLLNLPIMLSIPDIRAQAVLPWFARMISGGLFRTAWNISAIGGAASPYRRARALRGVRNADGNVVLSEVAQAAEDPDPVVRREALLALGRIGTPEAIELLVWYIHEPDRATRTAAAEALGKTHGSEGTIPLITTLHDDDVNVRRAAAGALANMADIRTVDTLLTLLKTETDAEVLVNVASALARLRERRALRPMVGMTLNNSSRIVRADITVAVGDLIGKPGQFYRLWRRERQLPGGASVRLSRQIRRLAKRLYRRQLKQNSDFSTGKQSLLVSIREDLDLFVERIQAEDYDEAISAICRVSLRFLELRYDYRGDTNHAGEFLAVHNPAISDSQWLVDHLGRTRLMGDAPEAYWDGLSLLLAWAILCGWQEVR